MRCSVLLHPAAVPWVCLCLAFLPAPLQTYGAAFVTAAAAHEAGHLLVIAHCGIPLQKIVISPVGLRFVCDFSVCSYRAEAFVHAAGGLLNLLTALCFRTAGRPEAAAAPLLLGCINLLPMESTDGGRCLAALLASSDGFSVSASRHFLKICSAVCSFIFYLFAGWLFFFLSRHGSLAGGILFFSAFSLFGNNSFSKENSLRV